MKAICLNWLLYFILLTAFVSCKKEKQCPSFGDSNTSFSPYIQDEILKFNNENTDTFEIYIQTFSYSESYTVEYRKAPFNAKEEACIRWCKLSATDNTSNKEYTFLEFEQSDVSSLSNYKYLLMDFYFEIDFDNEVQFIEDFDYMKLIPNLTIDSINYSGVIQYSDLQNTSNQIRSVYLTKTNGIISFIDEDGIQWNLTQGK